MKDDRIDVPTVTGFEAKVICILVGGGCLAAVLIGSVASPFVDRWTMVAGMAAVGIVYMVLGLFIAKTQRFDASGQVTTPSRGMLGHLQHDASGETIPFADQDECHVGDDAEEGFATEYWR